MVNIFGVIVQWLSIVALGDYMALPIGDGIGVHEDSPLYDMAYMVRGVLYRGSI